MGMIRDFIETRKEKASAADLFKRVDDAEIRKSGLKTRWKALQAFHAGEQHIQYSETAMTLLRASSAYRNQTEIAVNLFQSFVGIGVSLMTRNEPIPRPTPQSDNPEDVANAKDATALLKHAWKVVDAQSQIETFATWAWVTGNAFLKVYWDEGGERGSPLYGMDEATGEVSIVGYSGVPRMEVIPPSQIGFNDTVGFKDSPWVYHKAVYTPEDIERRWDVTVEPDSNPEDPEAGGVLRFDGSGKGSHTKTGVTVLEWWERPCKKYPEGRHIICTKEKVFVDEGWPDDIPWPIYHYYLEPSLGSPYGRTPFWDFKQIQEGFNRLIEELFDHISVSNYPQMMAPQGTFDSGGNSYQRGPAKIQTYKMQGIAPQTMKSERLEQWVEQLPEKMLSWGEQVLGMSGVNLGQAPFSRASGRTLGMLSEQTTNRYANATIRFANVLCDVAKALLVLWTQFGPEEVTVRIVGNDGASRMRTINRDRISYSNIELEPSEVAATSKWALMETMEKWVQFQVLDAPNFLRIVEKFYPELSMLDQSALDRAWARRNIDDLKTGAPVIEPRPPMNFEVHFEETADYMKTAEFFDLQMEIQENFRTYLELLQANIAPPQEAGGPMPGNTSTEAGVPGPVPSPGAIGVPPEMNGATNFGLDLDEEAAVRGMS